MLLRGIELHRHMHRHGHNRQRTDPQTERNELKEIDKPVDKTQMADAMNIRSNPGDKIGKELKRDGTKMAQDKPHDGNITPKPGLRKNKLVAKYRTNFRYLGIVKNGIESDSAHIDTNTKV